MASAYTKIYEYKDPISLDISSTLGKASTYKQNLYDTNSSQIQQLVNQYVGTDLLRDVDQKYLGDRLKTLTNYINQSGAMDWSRRTVFDDVSNYVGQALDANVMAGVASTQRYRKHQLQMDDLKKNKPDLYSIQNDWAATRDFNRYMSSGQLGDMYKQGSYTPFTDVNKLITEGLPKLKEFMIDVRYTNDGQPVLIRKTEEMVPGNEPNLLVKVEKHETLSEQEASQYLNMIIGTQGQQQLSIDGMYRYKNNTPDEIRGEYKTKLSSEASSYKTMADNYNVQQAGKSDEQKKILKNYSEQYNERANQILDQVKKVDTLDPDLVAASMYSSDFNSKWSKLLSFDRVIDWKYDDKNLRLAERNDSLRQKQWEQDFNEDKFAAETKWKQKAYDLDLAKAIGDGSISLDSNDNPIPGVAKAQKSGITETSNKTELAGDVPEDILPEDVMDNFSNAYNVAKKDTKNYIKELMSTETGMKLIREHYGDISEKDSDKLMYTMMRGTPDAQKTLNNLRGVMNTSEAGRKALSSISNSITAYRQKEKMKPLLNEALKGVSDITKTIMQADNIDKDFYGLSGKIVNKDGKLTNGSYIGKDFDQLNSQEKLGAQIGSISNRLFAGKIPEAERSALMVLRKNLIAQVKDKSARDYYNDIEAEDNTSAWDSLTSQLSAAGQKIRMAWNSTAPTLIPGRALFQAIRGTGDEERQAHDDAKKTYEANTKNAGRYWDRAGRHIQDMFNTNYTMNDLASNDLTRRGKTLSLGKTDGKYNQSADEAYNQKIAPALKTLNDRLQDGNTFKLANKTLNLNTEDKNVKANYESWVKAQFDEEVQGNSNVRVNVNSTDGTVTVTAPVKAGKTFENKTTAPIAFAELPENLKSQIITNNSYEYDAGSNPNASPLYIQGLVYSSDNRINELYGDLESNPTTKRASFETVKEQVENTIGKENYNKYKQEIDKIIQTPVDMVARPVQGVYVMDFKSGNMLLDKQQMGVNIADRIDLIADQKDKISVDKIIQYIQQKYNK